MNIEQDDQNVALDKILAALREAAPPEGMEARIAQQLQQHSTSPQVAPFRWTNAFANSADAAWWRGAITGAASMLLVAGGLLLANHLQPTHRNRESTARSSTAGGSATLVTASSHAAAANEASAQPCAHPTMLRTASIAPTHKPESLLADTRVESAAPSHPAPALPLTAEERGLVQIVHTADPKTLATLTPETQAKLQAQEAAEFDKFFSPSPAPLPSETHE